MGKHLVLIGGGHAHMVTLANLTHFITQGHRVSVIGPSPHHYYSGMGPGMLGQVYTPDEIRFATQRVVEKQGGTFVPDRVTRVDAEQKKVLLASGESLSYDVLSINAGSYVPRTIVTGDGRDIFGAKPIEALLEAQARVLEMLEGKTARIGVIGGGPAAVEIAGNAWRLAKDRGKYQPLIQVFSGEALMARFHPGVRRKVGASLKHRGIEVLENASVREVTTGEITLVNGDTHAVDLVFLALGVRPSPIFKDSGLQTGPDGGLRVNTYLQCTQHPEIFGGGDCIYFEPHPLDKVGVYAVRQNPILYHNLGATLAQTELKPFEPGGDYLLIFNLGDGTGVLQKNWFIMGGRLAFLIKDYIDRRFMKRFQAAE